MLILVPSVAALLALLGVSGAEAQTECMRDVITVEGRASVDVRPNLVRISMVAAQTAPGLAQAEAAVRSATESVTAVAREQSVVDADIEASDYSLQAIFEWGDGKKLRKRIGFRVQRTVVVTLRDLSRFGAFLARVSELGVVSVSDVTADIDNTRAQRDAARLLAVRAAREKAQAIVSELGQALGPATTIEVDGATVSRSCGDRQASSGYSSANVTTLVRGDEGPTYGVGAITLSAAVKVTFQLKGGATP